MIFMTFRKKVDERKSRKKFNDRVCSDKTIQDFCKEKRNWIIRSPYPLDKQWISLIGYDN